MNWMQKILATGYNMEKPSENDAGLLLLLPLLFYVNLYYKY